LTATDPNANGGPATTTTAYTPPAGALPTRRRHQPVAGGTTTTLDPTRGVPTHVVDQNGQVTDLTYDGLGRITAVWLPGRAKATQSANKLFTYLCQRVDPVIVDRDADPAERGRLRRHLQHLSGFG